MQNTTRQKLLQATFQEIYQNGYNGSGLTQILKSAGVNKGSMYHIFKSKKEMLLAVIDEILEPRLLEKYGSIVDEKNNFMQKTFELLKDDSEYDFIRGCPLNNLVHELSANDKEFKEKLEKLYFKFENILEEIIKKAIEIDGLKVENPNSFAIYFIAVIQGALSTAKKSQDRAYYKLVIDELEKTVKKLY